MTKLSEICDYLEQFAPALLAEDWDNVGLLAGDRLANVKRVMTCLTITPASATEAIQQDADLIISHHPMPFRALKRLTTDSTPGRLLWELIGQGVAIYSPHTAFDSAAAGINQRLAEGLGLRDVVPLVSIEGAPEGTGSGRCGRLEEAASLQQLAERLKRFLQIEHLQYVGDPVTSLQRVAVACGAAGEFLESAARSAVICWWSAKPTCTRAWKRNRAASRCCCRGTMPVSGLRSNPWPTNSPAVFPSWRHGSASANATLCVGTDARAAIRPTVPYASACTGSRTALLTMVTSLPISLKDTESMKVRINSRPRPLAFSRLAGSVGSGRLFGSKPGP